MKRNLTDRARTLRRQRTYAEHLLWQVLRNRQCAGRKFRFQHAIPPYVVDFVCLEACVIVEVDGGHHNKRVDTERTAFLKRRGFLVLRFWNNDVIENLEGVFERIRFSIDPPP